MTCQTSLGLLSRLIRRFCFALISSLVVMWTTGRADDVVPIDGGNEVSPSAEAGVTPAAPPEWQREPPAAGFATAPAAHGGRRLRGRPPATRLLVLSNGRIVEGEISQNAGGFVVDKPTGSMLVPFDLVKFVADDRDDAYRKMRATSAAPTAESHIALARWCITNQYFREAAAELREALKLEPDRDDARRMLRRLEDIFRPQNPKYQSVAPDEDWLADSSEVPEAQSLARLDPDTAHQYVRRIQPLLMNKCATAGCHGPSAAEGFQLQRVRFGRGSARIASERNLATLKKFINPRDADASPLLTVPRGDHGRGGQAIFQGASGPEQIELLREWVRRMARDMSRGEQKEHQKPKFPPGATGGLSTRAGVRAPFPLAGKPPVPPATGSLSTRAGVRAPFPPAGKPPLRPAGPAPRPPASTVPAGVEPAADPDQNLRQLLRKSRNDAFDPDEFNRNAR